MRLFAYIVSLEAISLDCETKHRAINQEAYDSGVY